MSRTARLGPVIALAVALCLLGSVSAREAEKKAKEPRGTHLAELFQVLQTARCMYVEPLDVAQLFGGALDGIGGALDPFSFFVPAAEVDAFSKAAPHEHTCGMVLLKERGVLYVAATVHGGPAQQAGVRVGSVITSINGVEPRRMPMWRVGQLMRGEPGTRVELDTSLRGKPGKHTVELAKFEAPRPALTIVDGTPVLTVGYVTRATVDHVREALQGFKAIGYERLVLDLRLSWGDDASQGFALADLFVKGPLGSLQRRGRTIERFAGSSDVAWTGKFVVLAARSTHGPAEVVATVLRQKLGVEIVGERTYGSAGKRELRRLSSGDALQLTIGFYAGPDNEPLTAGVEPDHLVRYGRDAEDRDTQLSRALERLKAAGEK